LPNREGGEPMSKADKKAEQIQKGFAIVKGWMK
jgi:hypothetical protein